MNELTVRQLILLLQQLGSVYLDTVVLIESSDGSYGNAGNVYVDPVTNRKILITLGN